ncbi:MAG: hypothetical protein C6I00_04045 [Nitratiruptor sp.]|nr:hypothetical protein [Nitratiruptor sp.]NPA83956.1 HDOD domain-containing protein [Campylobacterota bacterium]
MALFGFGKKKVERETSKQEVEEVHFKSLTRRAYPRYLVEPFQTSLGKAIDLSKNSILLAAPGLKEQDRIELEIEGEKYEGTVTRVYGSKGVIRLDRELPRELIQRHMKQVERGRVKPRRFIDLERLSSDGDVQSDRAIINLMLEIEDPNTDITKFKGNIQALPELEAKILSQANSIEMGGRGRIDDVGVAVTRLGFDAMKRMVYQYVTYEASLSHNKLEFFEDFELYNILLGATFKKIAPLFNFKDIKNEGQSLLTMSSVGALILSKEAPAIAPLYRGVKELFSYEMRMVERRACGYDFLEVDRRYFLEDLGVFRYIYDGFVLANYMLYPHYNPKELTLSLSQRKLRFAYVTYLTLLAQRFIFSRDKYSGFVFLHRMRRLGFELQEAKQWLDFLIDNTNKKLARIGIQKRILKPDIPSWQISLEGYLGRGGYATYFLERLEDLGKEAQRLAIRFEDGAYTHLVLELAINDERFPFLGMPFCVIPCERLEDEELPLAMFEGFDLLLFKNIDQLKPALFKEFQKLWKDFEGKIIVTLSTSSMVEYNQKPLYALIKDQLIDFPSYFQSPLVQMKMLSLGCQRLNQLFNQDVCQLEAFKDRTIDMEKLYETVLEEVL